VWIVIADVFHFSFTVGDIDRSVAWYTEILGLELVHRQRQENSYTPVLVGIPGAVLEVAQLKVPNVDSKYSTHMLELVHYVEGGGGKPDLPINKVGATHLALLVTDIHERYERMVKAGVIFRNPPVEITAGVNQGGFACYFQDPDGITLELLQFSPERAARLGIKKTAV
jgi:lactoylglutathione lyase